MYALREALKDPFEVPAIYLIDYRGTTIKYWVSAPGWMHAPLLDCPVLVTYSFADEMPYVGATPASMYSFWQELPYITYGDAVKTL